MIKLPKETRALALGAVALMGGFTSACTTTSEGAAVNSSGTRLVGPSMNGRWLQGNIDYASDAFKSFTIIGTVDNRPPPGADRYRVRLGDTGCWALMTRTNVYPVRRGIGGGVLYNYDYNQEIVCDVDYTGDNQRGVYGNDFVRGIPGVAPPDFGPVSRCYDEAPTENVRRPGDRVPPGYCVTIRPFRR